jgi:hypothetical protein
MNIMAKKKVIAISKAKATSLNEKKSTAQSKVSTSCPKIGKAIEDFTGKHDATDIEPVPIGGEKSIFIEDLAKLEGKE